MTAERVVKIRSHFAANGGRAGGGGPFCGEGEREITIRAQLQNCQDFAGQKTGLISAVQILNFPANRIRNERARLPLLRCDFVIAFLPLFASRAFPSKSLD